MKNGKLSAIVLMACAFVMCLALAACGSAGSASSSSSDAAASSSSAAAASASSSSAAETSASESSSSSSEASASASSSSAAESYLSDEEKEAFKGSFTGDWKMVAMSDGQSVMRMKDADEEAQKKAEVTAAFNDDYSTEWSVMGEKRTGTWEPTGENTIIIHFDAIEGFDEVPAYTGTLEDGTLAVDEQGIVMLLEKAE